MRGVIDSHMIIKRWQVATSKICVRSNSYFLGISVLDS